LTEKTKKRNDGRQIVEACNFHETSGEPRDNVPAEGINILRDIGRLLTLTTRRDATVMHEPGTVEKVSQVLLTSIMLDCGLDDAKAQLDSVQELFRRYLIMIYESNDIRAKVRTEIERLDSANKKSLFSVHRTTVAEMIPHADRSELDKCLAEQYKECMIELEMIGTKSNALIIAGDETHEKVRSKYYNGNFSYVVVGQTSTWQRGFVYPTEYDATHQLFMGSRHRDYRLIDSEKKGLRPWIRDVTAKCKLARELGIDQIIIEGDRTYFNATLFALAALGKIDPGTIPGHQPRVIVPRKFTREKDEYKWEYLLDTKRKQVFTDYIGLNPYNNPALKAECESTFTRAKNYHLLIPYTCVATVDEYGSRKKRTLEDIRSKAMKIQASIDHETASKPELIKVYMEISTQENKKVPQEPSFGRGAKRQRFKSDKERRAYEACFKCHALLEKLKKEKASLLKTLMFFAISRVPGDDPDANPSMFIAFAHDYHERWGIENGFRDVKERFLSKGRSRQPCLRQLRLILGMMLYNRWEVKRRKSACVRKSEKNDRAPSTSTPRPWIRHKFERECTCLPTAVGFLVTAWCAGILSLLMVNF
jgi:hypothetical protein